MCPESGQAPQECCLRVSLMPLRLNIDQVKVFDTDGFYTCVLCNLLCDVFCFVLFVPRMRCSSWRTSSQVSRLRSSFSRHLLKKVKKKVPQTATELNINPFCQYWLLMTFCSVVVCVSTKKTAAPEITCSFSKPASSSQDPAPIISVPAQRRSSHNGFTTSGREEVNDNEASATSFTDQPIFFRLVK